MSQPPHEPPDEPLGGSLAPGPEDMPARPEAWDADSPFQPPTPDDRADDSGPADAAPTGDAPTQTPVTGPPSAPPPPPPPAPGYGGNYPPPPPPPAATWGSPPPPPPPAAGYGGSYPPGGAPGVWQPGSPGGSWAQGGAPGDSWAQAGSGFQPTPFRAPPSVPGRATAVLVLGIVSLVLLCAYGLGLLPAIIALALAPGARREIRGSGGVYTGESQVRAGVICAWISLAIVAAMSVLTIMSLILDGTNY